MSDTLTPAPISPEADPDLAAAVQTAVATVDDPEYPGVSIADLGLVERSTVQPGGVATVDLIPTFSGCPALAVIAADVAEAVQSVPGVTEVTVNWLTAPVWTTDRITPTGAAALADRFTVAVEIGTRDTACPRCGAPLTPHNLFGPSRCRRVARCEACTETVEVMRA